MKILHLATSLNGGAGIAARRIAESQRELGMEVELWAGNGAGAQLKEFEKVIHTRQLTRLKSKALTFYQAQVIQNSDFLITSLTKRILNLNDISQNKFDLINLHASYNFVDLTDLKKNFPNLPIVVTMHDQRSFTGGCHYSLECLGFRSDCAHCPQVREAFRAIPVRTLNRRLLLENRLKSVKYVSPSVWLAEKAGESKILSNEIISVIRNPVPAEFKPISRERNFSENQLVLGFISENLNNPFKGLPTLLKAISSLSSRREITLRLIGNGEVNMDGLNIKVVMTYCRTKEDVVAQIQKCDLMIVPSIEDNLPSVISESLMCGVPVIGSETGGISEILKQFNLPTFKKGDSVELESRISEFKTVNSKTLASQARKTFSYDVIGNLYRELYKGILT